MVNLIIYSIFFAININFGYLYEIETSGVDLNAIPNYINKSIVLYERHVILLNADPDETIDSFSKFNELFINASQLTRNETLKSVESAADAEEENDSYEQMPMEYHHAQNMITLLLNLYKGRFEHVTKIYGSYIFSLYIQDQARWGLNDLLTEFDEALEKLKDLGNSVQVLFSVEIFNLIRLRNEIDAKSEIINADNDFEHEEQVDRPINTAEVAPPHLFPAFFTYDAQAISVLSSVNGDAEETSREFSKLDDLFKLETKGLRKTSLEFIDVAVTGNNSNYEFVKAENLLNLTAHIVDYRYTMILKHKNNYTSLYLNNILTEGLLIVVKEIDELVDSLNQMNNHIDVIHLFGWSITDFKRRSDNVRADYEKYKKEEIAANEAANGLPDVTEEVLTEFIKDSIDSYEKIPILVYPGDTHQTRWSFRHSDAKFKLISDLLQNITFDAIKEGVSAEKYSGMSDNHTHEFSRAGNLLNLTVKVFYKRANYLTKLLETNPDLSVKTEIKWSLNLLLTEMLNTINRLRDNGYENQFEFQFQELNEKYNEIQDIIDEITEEMEEN